MPSKPSIARWLESLQSTGRYTFTKDQARTECQKSKKAVQAALGRLKKSGRVACPRSGFYVIVPPEYRAYGSLPASWFIDDLMAYLRQPYYVGLLSAAALHGAAHQQPMVFQVVTDKPIRKISSGKISIQFHVSGILEKTPTVNLQTETGTMIVSTPEATAFDLVRYPAGAGHLSNTATILAELSERIDAEALAVIAPLVKLPDLQRLGFFLDAVGARDLADPLAEWLRQHRPRAVPLRRSGSTKGFQPVERWKLLPNEELEIDL